MSHARVEELSDSDPDEADISTVASSLSTPSTLHPGSIPFRGVPRGVSVGGSGGAAGSQLRSPQQMTQEQTKRWQCLYPVYFDAGRSKAEGRRVGRAAAVTNPLAREIVDAAQKLGLNVVFEPSKTHPKDWANPGRVRVLLVEEGERVAPHIKNKRHLYSMVAENLKMHPTTETTPLRLHIPGMPRTTEPPPPPAIPKGWKMGTILPLHSAALSGGGVSENLFKDMMQSMSGEAGPDTGSVKAKKEKKKLKS